MEPIRVLHVVTKMDAAGLETLLMNIYRSIDRNKIQFDFLTHRDSEGFYDKEIIELGGHIYSVPPINPLKHVEYISALDNFFWTNRHKYKIVHSHINTFSMYPLRAAQKAGVPIRIAHSHASGGSLDIKIPFKIYTRMNLKKYSTHNFGCSANAGKYLFGKKAVNLKNFSIINNAIDSKMYTYSELIEHKIKNKLNIEDKYIIGHVGRFTKLKNHSFLIDIFKEVHKKNNHARLMLIGEGELESKIKRQVKDAGLENEVLFMGVQDNIPEIMQAIDVFVLPSISEGLPLVIIEAQAAGIPCVVSPAVPKEAVITSSVFSHSLQEGTEVWTNSVLKAKKIKKYDTYSVILSSGYDISDEAKKIQLFYEEMHKN